MIEKDPIVLYIVMQALLVSFLFAWVANQGTDKRTLELRVDSLMTRISVLEDTTTITWDNERED